MEYKIRVHVPPAHLFKASKQVRYTALGPPAKRVAHHLRGAGLDGVLGTSCVIECNYLCDVVVSDGHVHAV